jgi:transcription antitermination protein NusB
VSAQRTAASDARAQRRAKARGAARLAAVQALYQMDVSDADLLSTLADFEVTRLETDGEGGDVVEPEMGFFRELVAGVVGAQRRIDPVIHQVLTEGWPLKRLDLTLRAILRSGAYEILERTDVPPRVAISQYVDVAHAFFGDGEEPGMVNAVLDRIARQARGQELKGDGGRR